MEVWARGVALKGASGCVVVEVAWCRQARKVVLADRAEECSIGRANARASVVRENMVLRIIEREGIEAVWV